MIIKPFFLFLIKIVLINIHSMYNFQFGNFPVSFVAFNQTSLILLILHIVMLIMTVLIIGTGIRLKFRIGLLKSH